MGRPCNTRNSASSAPFSMVTSAPGRSSVLVLRGMDWSPIFTVVPRKKYRFRVLSAAAGGRVNVACGSILMVQIATSDSARAAHECGGGAGAREAPNFPATTIDRKSTRLNSSHVAISYAVFCLKKKTKNRAAKYRYQTFVRCTAHSHI